jgi:hypothetical protein
MTSPARQMRTPARFIVAPPGITGTPARFIVTRARPTNRRPDKTEDEPGRTATPARFRGQPPASAVGPARTMVGRARVAVGRPHGTTSRAWSMVNGARGTGEGARLSDDATRASGPEPLTTSPRRARSPRAGRHAAAVTRPRLRQHRRHDHLAARASPPPVSRLGVTSGRVDAPSPVPGGVPPSRPPSRPPSLVPLESPTTRPFEQDAARRVGGEQPGERSYAVPGVAARPSRPRRRKPSDATLVRRRTREIER